VADSLERVPEDPGDLYDYRDADHIPLWLPYNQGDVFRDVPIPEVLGGGVGLAMLFMHPCTMREGASIRHLQTVIKVDVKTKRKVLGPDQWEGWFKGMPLPDLDNGQHSTHQADFMRIWTVSATDLPRDHRISQLSHSGRLILQQRLVHHLVRYAPDLRVVESVTLPVSEEILLQGEWVSLGLMALGKNESDITAIHDLESLFDECMNDRPDGSELTLRKMLELEGERRDAHNVVNARIAKFPDGLELPKREPDAESDGRRHDG